MGRGEGSHGQQGPERPKHTYLTARRPPKTSRFDAHWPAPSLRSPTRPPVDARTPRALSCPLNAGVAKLVYATDSKSVGDHSPCRFESDLRHQTPTGFKIILTEKDKRAAEALPITSAVLFP